MVSNHNDAHRHDAGGRGVGTGGLGGQALNPNGITTCGFMVVLVTELLH